MKETLLQHRIKQRNEAVDNLLIRAETLRKCRDGAHSDLNTHISDVMTLAVQANRLAGLVQELEDVEKYGPGGGR